jgi:protein-L-isoaspartate(D-aspartate) O-methyltransferase
MTDFAAARHNMIESQIRTNRVTDPALLDALAAVPRELFVPVERRGFAYVDEDIRIGRDRFLMEPAVLARLVQAAEPSKTDVALDIGCATGYSTAVLARLVATAIGVDPDPTLVRAAGETLAGLSVDNAVVVEGAFADGDAKHAPYDVILVGGAVAEIPPAFFAQLAEGGRLVGVRRAGRGLGEAMLYVKRAGAVSGRAIFDAAIPYLPGFAPAPRFAF